MVGDNNQRNTEDTNSEIRQTHFFGQDKNKAAVSNSKILVAFNGELGAEISAQKGNPFNYGSEFCDTADFKKLFYYHEDKINIINIIQKGLRYHIDPIKEETRKSDLDAMILGGNHKPSHPEMNSAALEKVIIKEIDHVWALTLTIKSLLIIKNAGTGPWGLQNNSQ